jgi:hypothetical protein
MNVRTYADTNRGRITYSADIELNGRELPGSIYLPEYISEQLEELGLTFTTRSRSSTTRMTQGLPMPWRTT